MHDHYRKKIIFTVNKATWFRRHCDIIGPVVLLFTVKLNILYEITHMIDFSVTYCILYKNVNQQILGMIS